MLKTKNRDIILVDANDNDNKLSKYLIVNSIPNIGENVYNKQHQKQRTKYHSAISRLKYDPVMRSKSFQVQGEKPILVRSRIFDNRQNNSSASDFSVDTVSQTIEINVQDEYGINVCDYRQNVNPSKPVNCSACSDGDENVKSGQIMSQIFRRMKKFSFGWRKPRCKIRRGDWRFFVFVFLFCLNYWSIIKYIYI